MKPSRYNFVYPYQFNKDYSVVYNTFKNTVGIVTAREAEFIRSCDRSLGIHYTKVGLFEKKGFIVDENTEELSILKVEYLKSKFNSKLLSVVIVPTYQCNLECANSYEKLSDSAADHTIMSEQIQDRICHWIGNHLNGVEKMEVFWHGGEPLVAFDAVRRLGGMLKKLAEEHGVEYDSMMSTNGYLFTESVAKELKELGITRYEMSIDGCKEKHDCQKRHKDGRETYDTILGNIEKSAKYTDEINLCINVDKEDLKDAYAIMEMLDEKGLSGKVISRLGKPKKFAEQKNDAAFTKEEFYCEAIRYSLMQGIGPEAFLKKNGFCQIDQWNGIIIDGHGTLFKCISDTEDGRNCGRLKDDGSMILNKIFYDYGMEHPVELKLCENCPFLPICTGECAHDRKQGNPCAFGSLEEACWAQLLNAYVVNRLLNRLKTKGFSSDSDNSIDIDDLIMGKYDKTVDQFIRNAASTYMLSDLNALAEKNNIRLSDDDAKLLLQLIQPTELAV